MELRNSLPLLFAFACVVASAQESIQYGTVSGSVVDQSGAAVQGASATARNTLTGISQSVLTGADGRFRFSYLRVGACELIVHRDGFADSKRVLNISPASAHEVAITLRVAGADTSVDVTAEAAMPEAARSQIASTVTEGEIRSTPLNGRNFLDLALLVPGVSPANTGSNQLFAETSAVPGQGLSVASQRNFANNFVVDGLSANDDAAGLSGMYFGVDTVQEFQVVTSGAQAEFGRALGGFVNVVTKSGTNALHGDLYSYFRNQRLNAANSLSHNKLPSTQAQYGVSVGGPLERNRSFWFGNFEQRILNQSGLVTISPAAVDAINTRLDAVGYQGARISSGRYPNPVHLTSGLAKFDRQFGTRDQFSFRYTGYGVDSSNSRMVGALNATTASADLDNADHAIAVSNVLTLSPRTVLETRGQIMFSDLEASPSDPTGPAVSIAGVATFGRAAGAPTGRRNTLSEVVANLSHQVGRHAFRVGFNTLYNDNTITYPRSARGSYSFSSLANFLQGVYNNSGFSQTFGNSIVSQTNPNLGIYVQDQWSVAPSLTLNAGLRYDLQFLKTIETDRNNISPRAGFAWSPFASRRTVVRGGFGLFYDRIPLRALANALLSSGNTTELTPESQVTVSLSPAQTGAPVFPAILASLPAAVLPNYSTMDRHIRSGYSTQTNIEVEHQLGARMTVSAGYQRLRGLHLIAALNQNAPTCLAVGNNNGCRPNAAYGNNSQYSSAADSVYNGLQLSLVQRPSHWSSYRISYTYSRSMNNTGEFFFSSPLDPRNIWLDYGRSDEDQRHRLVVSGDLNARWFEVSGVLQYYSALPLNITTGASTIQGTPARPQVNGAYIPRNSAEGPDFVGLSLRVTRTFRLTDRLKMQWNAEAFNALNHTNNLTQNGVFGTGAYPASPSATFRQVTAVQDPRVMQLAVRLSF